jgi:UPF0716 family protein affecting phage T7 exclusion
MSARRGRFLFGVAFVLLLVDGAAAVWLGQVTGKWSFLILGLALLLGAVGLVPLYGYWRRAVDEIEAARKELKEEIGALKSALDGARAGRRRQ